jgi:RHS repeat-associated protein
VYSGGAWGSHNVYHADGNGNVTALVNSSQALSAGYRYNPYGAVIGMSGGSMTNQNVYRFSSKEQMPNSGLYYYGYRFYDPNLQRWLNRDPLADSGDLLGLWMRVRLGLVGSPFENWSGANLYTYVQNGPLDKYDPRGLLTPEEIRQVIALLDQGLDQYPVGSDMWKLMYRQRAEWYRELQKALAEQAKRQALRRVCKIGRGGGITLAAGVGAFTGYYIGDEVNNGFYTGGLLFWDWWYGNSKYEIGINF